MEDDFDAISITIKTLPAHGFMHIMNHESDGYFDFWDKQAQIPGQDCDTITRLLGTIQGKLDGGEEVTGLYDGQVMARLWLEDSSPEAYGVRLPEDYSGPVPKPLILLAVPEADYIVFEHGPFDYDREGDRVYRLLRKVRDNFSCQDLDFEPDYSPGRLAYYYFDPARYARYVLPVRRKQDD